MELPAEDSFFAFWGYVKNIASTLIALFRFNRSKIKAIPRITFVAISTAQLCSNCL